MKEDLIKLKESIQKEAYFVPIYGAKRHIVIGGVGKTISQIKEEENTDGVILECEELMKNIIKFFGKHDIICSSIGITSDTGFFVAKGLADRIKEELRKVNNRKDEALFRKEFAGKTLTRYIPVEFSINWGDCFISEEFVPATIKSGRYCVTNLPQSTFEKTAKNIQEEKVSGIVDIEKFISKLNEMGYTVEDLNHKKITSFVKYMDSYIDTIDSEKEMAFCIRADLRQKEETKEKVAVK